MKQLADNDSVHVHGGGDFQGVLPIQIHGPSAAQLAQLLAWLSGPQTQPHSD